MACPSLLTAHLCIVAIWQAQDEGVSIGLGAGRDGLLPRRVLLPHHNVLYDGGGKQDGLLSDQADQRAQPPKI